MKRTFYILIISLLSSIFLLGGCKDTYKVIKSNSRNEVVQRDFSTQDSLYGLITPYKNKLDSSMSEVLNHSEIDMEIGIPEGILGNYICDIVLSMGRNKSTGQIDFCLLNNDIIIKDKIGTHNGKLYITYLPMFEVPPPAPKIINASGIRNIGNKTT